MNKKDVDKLPLGLYILHWKTGGSSLASVGQDEAGRKWYAPTNWITVPGRDWKIIEKSEEVRSRRVQLFFDQRAES